MSFIKHAPGTINKIVTSQASHKAYEIICAEISRLIKLGELKENEIHELIPHGIPKEAIDFYKDVFTTKEYQLYQLLK